jgi:hypothetical protein
VESQCDDGGDRGVSTFSNRSLNADAGGGQDRRRGLIAGANIRDVMSNVESLEREVEQLAPEELAAFRAWLIEHYWRAWDRELEQDVAAGRLDHLADEALAEYERGETMGL